MSSTSSSGGGEPDGHSSFTVTIPGSSGWSIMCHRHAPTHQPPNPDAEPFLHPRMSRAQPSNDDPQANSAAIVESSAGDPENQELTVVAGWHSSAVCQSPK
jgi:hypothetical protein